MNAIPYVVGGLLVVTTAAGCAGSSASTPGSTASAQSRAKTTTITVLAAASLTESFTTIGEAFETKYTGTKVVFSFGASSALATSITQGSPGDVFASASKKTMQTVVEAKAASDPVTFANNLVEIAVPPANPAKVTALADLAKPGVKVAVCQAAVPCGVSAATVFKNAKLTVKPVTEEADVKSVLTKVTLGEVDAGVVYVTDVKAAGSKVTGIEIPADVNASTAYPIATIAKTTHADVAKEFVDYVLSADGQRVLADAGFMKP